MEPCFYKNERQLNIRREAAEQVVAAVYKVFSLESTDLTWLGKLTDVHNVCATALLWVWQAASAMQNSTNIKRKIVFIVIISSFIR